MYTPSEAAQQKAEARAKREQSRKATNPWKSRTLRSRKVKQVRCTLVRIEYETRTYEGMKREPKYWLVKASDGTNRRANSIEEAERLFALLLEFENHQLLIGEKV